MKTSFRQFVVAILAGSFGVCFLINCSKKNNNPVPSQKNTVVVSTFAGNGTAGQATGSGNIAAFSYPAGVVFNAASGNLFVSDNGLRQVREITLDGSVSVFAGTVNNNNNAFPSIKDGVGTSAAFDNPTSITVDGSGNIYVLEADSRYLRKITPGSVVTTIKVKDVNGNTFDFDVGYIRAITADATGNIYADVIKEGIAIPHETPDAQELIYKINLDGSASFIAGGTVGFSNGNGASALFNGVLGIVADASGNLYAADYGNREIRKITPNGDVTTFAGNVNAGFPGGAEYTDGQGTSASFNMPYGITIDKKGNLFVTDVVEERVRKISPTGLVTTVAGTGAYGLTNGPGNLATFNSPIGITVDNNDNLYVLDYNNKVIRKIVLNN